MKKSLLSALALSAVLLTSCSNEELVTPGNDGNVVFTVALPGDFATRAGDISDGKKATKLSYAVYLTGTKNALFATGKEESPVAADFSSLKTTLALNLAKGKTYDIIFWADKGENSPYTFSPADQTITVNYDNVTSNLEDRDAFFASKTITVTGAMEENITLKRPFAQLNFATSDLEAANKAGLDFGKTQVKVTGVHNTLNLLTGVASDSEGWDNSVTFGYAGLVDNVLHNGTADKKYNWLSMNYFLTGVEILDGDVQKADKETVDCEFKVQDKNSQEINIINIANVPVQRNYRTNIYGELLTSTVNFAINIEPSYNGSDVDISYDAVVNNQTDFVDALTSGKSNILLGEGEYDLSSYSSTNAAQNVIIYGAGKDKTNVKLPISIYTEGKSIGFQGLTYTVPTGLDYTEGTFGWIQRANDVNFKDCRIEGSLRLNINNGSVANIDNCEFVVNTGSGFDGYGLFYYAATGSKVNVTNCTFNTVSKGIVMYNESANVYDLTVENCTFNASTTETNDKCAIQMHTEWGISGNLHINNCIATGGFMKKNGGLWNEVNNSVKPNVDTYKFNIWVDGKQVHMASGKATVNGTTYNTLKEAIAAATNGEIIQLGAGSFICDDISWPTSGTLKLVGNGADKTAIYNVDFENVSFDNVDFSNLKLTPTYNQYNHTALGFKNIKTAKYTKVTFDGEYHAYASESEQFDNCKFEYNALTDPKNGGRYNMYYERPKSLTLNNCEFSNVSDRGLLLYTSESSYMGEKKNLIVNNCSWTASATQTGKTRGAIEIHTEGVNGVTNVGGTVTIKNSSCSATFLKGICYEVDNLTKQETNLFKVTVDGVER